MRSLAGASVFRRYGYLWVTAVLFGGSLLAQWITHSGSTGQFINAIAENWQSEFLQLIWQVAGLKILLAVGSPQSKEGSERLERKVDEIARAVALLHDRPSEGARFLRDIDEEFGR